MQSDTCLTALLVLCVSIGALRAEGLDASSESGADLRARHCGKAGLYLRPSTGARTTQRELYLRHPLLDAVVLSTFWREVEPQRGQYSFEQLREEVAAWGKAGKGVVICLGLYGQAVDDQLTPPWIYEQPGVRELSFKGGGVARGRQIRIPAVWDQGFFDRYVEPMVRRFAEEFDGHPYVWYVMPGFGHIGNVTCQPSAGGSAACLEAGWTPREWSDYCRRVMQVYGEHFRQTPVFLKAAGMYIRDRQRDHYREECGQLLLEFARQGACVVHFGLEGDRSEMQDVYRHLAMLLPEARQGISRIGLGDDWPLWVPEDRRDQGPTRDHDEANLGRTLENAFGGADGVPEIPTTVLFCQQPEILASHPDAEGYRPAVADALERARRRLKTNDQLLSADNHPK